MKTILCFMIAAMLCLLGSMPYSVRNSSELIYFGSGYNGSVYDGDATEYISYATKSETDYTIVGGLPRYYDMSTRPKTCANVAGTIVLGYYDKIYDELIPDFTSARVIKDKILYNTQTDAVQNVMDQLYVSMETNSTVTGGTTVEGFKNGLKSYVNGKERSISYSATGSNNKLDRTAFINAIQNNHPVALFVSKYSLIPINDFSISESQDRLEKKKYSGNHVLIGCGLKEISYFNSNGTLQKTLSLITVATGYSLDPLYYIDLSDCGFIDSYSIDIY